MAELLRSAWEVSDRGQIMLLVTHEMNFAREVADRVLFFADGGIYEQGAPSEIFDSPKREKTIAFIRKIKYFTFDISEKRFDLMAMQGGIQGFVEKYGIEADRVYPLQVCSEEMVVDFLNHCFPDGDAADVHLEISHADANRSVIIQVASGGKPCSPLEESDNFIAVAIIKRAAQRTDYRFEQNRNQLIIVL